MEIKNAIGKVKGTGIVVRGNDIDTDQIIPARYMKVVTFDGLGQYAFYDQRYDDNGKPVDHPFNSEVYKNASVLLVNRNFGCGSSREHAPQALMRSGIKAVVGESFAEIFAGNCTAMGVPAVALSAKDIGTAMGIVEAEPKTVITVDLPSSTVTVGKETFEFTMPASYRNALIAGSWDSTSVLLENLDQIESTAKRLPYVQGFAQAG